MKVEIVPLDDRAFLALDPAARRDGHDWIEICDWLNTGCAAVWKIGESGYVLTLANGDDEIEILLGGGENARACAGPWEEAALAHPAHRGKTLRLEGRKGWRRIFRHWDERDGVLYKEVAG